MTDLQDMLSSLPLAQAEEELQRQIGGLSEEEYEAKRAVLLAILADEALTRLEAVDATDFPEKLQARMEELRLRHEGSRDLLRLHREQNGGWIKAVETADAEVADLDRQVGTLLERYDELLRSLIVRRDETPAGLL